MPPARRFPPWAFGTLGASLALAAGLVFTTEPSQPFAFPWHVVGALIILATAPASSLWFRPGRRRDALLAIWIGAAAVVVGAGIVAGGGLGLMVAPVYLLLVSLSLLAGALAQALLEETIAYVRRRRSLTSA